MNTPVLRVKKPWGEEIIYARANGYVGKLIVVEKGHRLSLQFHRRKHETFYVLKGRCRVTAGKQTSLLLAGGAFAIPPKTIHRFEAPYGRVTLLEASTGPDSDIVRLSDDYGRAKSKRRK